MGNNNSRNTNDNTKKVAVVAGAVVGGVILGAATFGVGYAVAVGITASGTAAAAAHEATKDGNNSNDRVRLSTSGGGSSTVSKASSPVWQSLSPWRGNIRSNNLSGSSRSYFTWDYTHCNIEKFNHRGIHMGSIDPISGSLCKGPQGYTINL